MKREMRELKSYYCNAGENIEKQIFLAFAVELAEEKGLTLSNQEIEELAKQLQDKFYSATSRVKFYERKAMSRKTSSIKEIREEIIESRIARIKDSSKRGKKAEKWEKLKRYEGLIKRLRDQEGLSYGAIAKYLAKYHRLKVSARYIEKFYKENQEV